MTGEVIDIEVVKRNLAYRIDQFRELKRPTAPDAWYCEELSTLSTHLRQHGICLLLGDFDWQGFRQRLVDSASARLDLMEWTRDAGVYFEHISCVSNNAPFFDALAGGQFDLSARIAEEPHAPYSKDYEYADDRAYTLFLHALVKADLQPDPSMRMHLDEFLEAAEGETSPRYMLCEALLESDAERFREALGDLVDEHMLAYHEEAEDGIRDHYRFRTDQYVFIEGLALRAIGQRMGMGVDQPLRFMPAE